VGLKKHVEEDKEELNKSFEDGVDERAFAPILLGIKWGNQRKKNLKKEEFGRGPESSYPL
jgi:hypothetical protein